jgi:hypothetical protein
LQGGLGHFTLWADNDVNWQMITAIKVGIDSIQIALRAQAGDLAPDVEHRMGHLTNDHVYLVRMGRGDNHIGIARTGPFKNIWIAGKA